MLTPKYIAIMWWWRWWLLLVLVLVLVVLVVAPSSQAIARLVGQGQSMGIYG
jgi:hypothetical protein